MAGFRGRRVLVIANPAAGLRRGRDAGASAVQGALRAGARCELARTLGPGEAATLAAEAAREGFELVFAGGGDGTAHEAANGLAGSQAALGVAPAGTMNLLARVLGLPLDPGAAAERLVAFGIARTVFPGEAAGRVFLLMAGVGFDAWVLRALLSRARGKIRFRDYVTGAVRGLATFPCPRITVRADGDTAVAHSAIVGRAPLYGGFLRPTPRADLGTPRFELCSFGGSMGHMARSVPAMWSGAHGNLPGVATRFATAVSMDADLPEVPVQLDGELAGTLPRSFTLSERRLLLAG